MTAYPQSQHRLLQSQRLSSVALLPLLQRRQRTVRERPNPDMTVSDLRLAYSKLPPHCPQRATGRCESQSRPRCVRRGSARRNISRTQQSGKTARLHTAEPILSSNAAGHARDQIELQCDTDSHQYMLKNFHQERDALLTDTIKTSSSFRPRRILAARSRGRVLKRS